MWFTYEFNNDIPVVQSLDTTIINAYPILFNLYILHDDPLK